MAVLNSVAVSLDILLPLEHFVAASNRTGVAAGRGSRGAFSLAGASLAGVESLMAEGLADSLADGGSVELHLGPQPLAPVASSESPLLVLLPGHGRGENHLAMGAVVPIRPVILPPAVLLHLSSFDAEGDSVVVPVVDQELHPRRDGLANPAVL